MDGVLRCSRYAFGPNRLHYCGPDANKEFGDLIKTEEDNFGLTHLLKQFKTLFPYLKYIAWANGIKDPFDSRVVEAYWLGNELLETIEKRAFHRFLVEDLAIKKKIGNKEFFWLEEKIGQGALPHHSFHVLNIWRRTGEADIAHTPESMYECCINSGVVTDVSGPDITVSTEPFFYKEGRFVLSPTVSQKITRALEAEYDIEQIKPGQTVSFHWGVPCEVITREQAETLKKYTLKNLAFANQTI